MSEIKYGEIIAFDEEKEEMILTTAEGDILYMKASEVGGIEKKGKCGSLLGISVTYLETTEADEKKYCSRLAAMKVIYDKEKDSLVEGANKKARIHKILRKGLIVDCCGLETLIPVDRCTNVYIEDLYELGEFELGEDINVIVNSYEDNKLELRVKLKPIDTSIYKVGNQYVGEVKSVREKNLFIQMPIGNVAMLCRNPNWKRMIQPGDKVKCAIEKIDNDTKRMWGHVITFVKRGKGN